MKLVSILLLFTLYTQAQCLSKKLRVDRDCSCLKNNSCLKLKSQILKNEISRGAKFLGKKKALSIYKLNLKSVGALDRMLKGDYSINRKEIEKIKKQTKKLERANKKLRPIVEKKLKALGFKEYRLDKRAANVDKFLKKIMKKNNIKSMKMDFSKSGLLASKKKEKTNFESEIDQLNKITNLKLNEQNKKDSINKNYKIDKEALNKAMKRKFKAKLIAKDRNIFKHISARYQRKYQSLIGNKIYYAIEVNPKRMRSSIDELLDKYFEN